MYEIKEQLIPGLPHRPYRNGSYEVVCAHETGAYGGTAESNRDYEARTWERAFVHFFVDWNSIVQTALTGYQAWGAGYPANEFCVHVELVRTRDADEFQESYKRYCWLLAKLLRDGNLRFSRSTLMGHDDIRREYGGTSHTDPYGYLASHGVSKDQFYDDVLEAYKGREIGHIDYKPQVKGEMIQLALYRGDDGKEVRELQKKLQRFGYYLNGEIDGSYGPKTEAAVRQFQRDHDLKVDGIAGPHTLGKLAALESDTAVFTLGGKTYQVKEID